MSSTCLNMETTRAESVEALDFEEIVDRYHSVLYQFAVGLVCDEADACDLVQHTFLLWASKGHLLRGETKVKCWLSITLYRHFVCNYQNEIRWVEQDIPEGEEALHFAVQEIVDRLGPRQLMECVQSLSETFRLPLLLFYLQEHSCKEIADILAIPIGTVVSCISRGKRKLQNAILSRQKREEGGGISMVGEHATAARMTAVRKCTQEGNLPPAPPMQRSGENDLGIRDPVTISQ